MLFAGTPAFALDSLRALCEAKRVPVAVLTRPDRPAGRGKRLTRSPVKAFALEHGLTVLTPASLRGADVAAALEALDPDLLVVVAYGLLLPESVLTLPRAGCVNVHASLLPRWRGAAPVQAAILAGDETTGVCLMSMTAGLDTGPVYAAEETPIGPGETAGELTERLGRLGAALLVRHLDAIVAGGLGASAQDESLATYAPKVRPADARLEFDKPAVLLSRRVRAYNPVPGAWFLLNGERIKCWTAYPAGASAGAPGTVLAVDDHGVSVACGEGTLVMTCLQRPGRTPLAAALLARSLEMTGRRLG